MINKMPPPPSTAISVLIRTFNSGKTLERLLSVLPLAEGDELVVVDSGSTDDTLAIASRHSARVIRLEGAFNYSKSLNVGFAAARDPWVLVLSSHCIPGSPRMLEFLRQGAARAEANVAVVYGQTALFKPDDADGPPETIDKARWEQTWQPPGGNGLALYRRICWEQHSFAESLATAEDFEWFLWSMNRGLSVLRVPQAWALYRHPGSLRYMFHKGWIEVISSATLLKAREPDLGHLAHMRNPLISAGALVKKAMRGLMPPGVCLRRIAYELGAYLASVLPTRKG
jgi:glycosyltransferase involved in cell wall biosynthesis